MVSRTRMRFTSPLSPSIANVFRRQAFVTAHPARSRMVSYSQAAAVLPTAMIDAVPVESATRLTKILPVDASKIGRITNVKSKDCLLDDWDVELIEHEEGVKYLQLAARELRNADTPVAFPTETVYGLGADATRSEAVKGIYKAKQRPSDNPLIVHFASLKQLKDMLSIGDKTTTDPIPSIYKPLIKRFWPGPLTIILPNPTNSPLAREVTAGLNTFGARIPRNLLALLLIKLANKPIAAPSANASTKPSPTAAEHVKEDLDGRINYIIDGGPCDVGVESTVVDGLSVPPAILRPGGLSIAQIRECPGWEDVAVGYEDVSQKNGAVPRAPGMKYRHYSPKATVVLYEAGSREPCRLTVEREHGTGKIGVIRTKLWRIAEEDTQLMTSQNNDSPVSFSQTPPPTSLLSLESLIPVTRPRVFRTNPHAHDSCCSWAIELGQSTSEIARDLFWALRELDRKGCEVICVEGIREDEGDVAAAVMNRLRKAAEVQVQVQV